MQIDAGMPATLIVGNQELGCFVKEVSGESIREADGSSIFSRIDEVIVAPWRSPYGTEIEEIDALKGVLDEEGACPEVCEALSEMRRKAEVKEVGGENAHETGGLEHAGGSDPACSVDGGDDSSENLVFVFTYYTPLGFSFCEVKARSRAEADELFWKDHHRDTCSITTVELLDPERQGDHRSDNRSRSRCHRPGKRSRDKLCPIPASPCKEDESVGDSGRHSSGEDVLDHGRVYRASHRIENDLVLFAGEPYEVKVSKLFKHAYLVRGALNVEILHPGDYVPLLSGMASDSDEVGDQVCGDRFHAPS